MTNLPILYQDKYLAAINKPAGLLVHRSPIDRHETRFALQMLRNQLNQHVFPIHRLDKPTSGVMLFALDSGTAKRISRDWHCVDKTYFALTRGKLHDITVNHPIHTLPENRYGEAKIQDAETVFNTLASATLPVVFGKNCDKFTHTTFSWVEAHPKTGRKHQIRKHLKHLSHPIIGDTRYGRGEINRYFRSQYGISRLLLHCAVLSLTHPVTERRIVIHAPLDSAWQTILGSLRPLQ